MLSVRLFSKRLFFFGLSACIMLALFGFSAQSGPESDALSLPLASVLRRLFGLPLADANRLVRKAAHFGAYFLLGGTLFGGFSTVFRAAGQRFRRFFFSETAAVLYALFDEWHQHFSAARTPALTDVCLDAAGAFCGALCFSALFALIRRRKPRVGGTPFYHPPQRKR